MSISIRSVIALVRTVLVAFVLVAAPVASTMAAGTDRGALVTDLTGAATFDGKTRGSLTILSVIQPNMRVRLGSAARLTVLMFESGDEFIFAGPAVIQFLPGEPQVLEGSKPEKRSNPYPRTGKGIRVDPSGMSQATFVMRGLRPTAPIKILSPLGMRVIDANPEFRWRAVETGAIYRLRLIDEAGNSIYDSEGQATSIRLPPSKTLQEGIHYSWNVSTSGRDGTLHVGSGILNLASSELRGEVDKLRPAEGAQVSERVTFAVWLMQMGLFDEARIYWKTLATERPQDAQLKSLSAE